jgi:chromosome segregation ATPase
MASNTKAAQAALDKDQAETPAPVDKPKAKRKSLTPEERVAKAEQDLADAKAKLESGDRKRHATLTEQKAKLEEKRDEAVSKITAIDAELSSIAARVPELAQASGSER